MPPTTAVVAVLAPHTAAKRVQPIWEAMAKPPGRAPIHLLSMEKASRAAPETMITSAMKMNSGTATRPKEFTLP